MPVNEQHLGNGSWNIEFSERAPIDLIDQVKYFGHIIIVPQWFDPATYSDASIKSLSGYTGIVTGIDFDNDGAMSLSGTSVAGWLGLAGRRGYIYQRERFYDEDTLTNVLTRSSSEPYGLFLKDDATAIGVTSGTITDPSSGASTYTGPHIYQTPQQAIEYVLGLWGQVYGYTMEYRVNPDGTVDIGQESDLFVTTPKVVIHRESGFDPEYRTIPTRTLGSQSDVEDFVTKVLIMSSGYGWSQTAVAAAVQSAFPSNMESLAISGTTIEQIGLVSQPFTTETYLINKAQEALADLNTIRNKITLDTEGYDISGGNYKVGDYVYIFDPLKGFYDTANEVYFEGRIINPMKLRLLSNSWAIEDGMGVFYRKGSGAYIDLTRYVLWESSDAKIAAS